jgi:hypothetical protein
MIIDGINIKLAADLVRLARGVPMALSRAEFFFFHRRLLRHGYGREAQAAWIIYSEGRS